MVLIDVPQYYLLKGNRKKAQLLLDNVAGHNSIPLPPL